jgi:hypothetical protein
VVLRLEARPNCSIMPARCMRACRAHFSIRHAAMRRGAWPARS